MENRVNMDTRPRAEYLDHSSPISVTSNMVCSTHLIHLIHEAGRKLAFATIDSDPFFPLGPSYSWHSRSATRSTMAVKQQNVNKQRAVTVVRFFCLFFLY